MFQSTHPHGVRLRACKRCIPVLVVSIHAPARGATPFGRRANVLRRFQSTHPHGVRLSNVRTCVIPDDVSIHAPARGATLDWFLFYHLSKFQSTHPHGVRRKRCCLRGKVNCFNPRTRTGCDQSNQKDKHNASKVSIHAPARGAT